MDAVKDVSSVRGLSVCYAIAPVIFEPRRRPSLWTNDTNKFGAGNWALLAVLVVPVSVFLDSL